MTAHGGGMYCPTPGPDLDGLTALLRAKADEYQRLAAAFAAQNPAPTERPEALLNPSPALNGATHA